MRLQRERIVLLWRLKEWVRTEMSVNVWQDSRHNIPEDSGLRVGQVID